MKKYITRLLLAATVLAAGATACQALDLDKRVLEAEKQRIAVVKKVSPSVVAVISGGGSGVLISEDGYALTNFHVTNAAGGPVMKCGLPDGILYDAVLVGLDKVGDVALIKLLPKKPGDKFPFAKLGDSDTVKAGDWSFAMGNPFLLATDFTPTVTYGMVSGVHRYQYPAGTLLEYTDCIQIDTSINPGNSGGPLFDVNGELIGINGRGSFEKRGRVNSGVGYAISINQIKNFMGQLRAGLDTDHATLGAVVESDKEEGSLGKLVVKAILDVKECDAARRGLETGDELVNFAGRPLTSVNQYKNVLGLYPKGWKVPLTYRRDNDKREILVRLMGVQKQEVPMGTRIDEQTQQPGPGPKPGPKPLPDSPASKLFEAKAGFANYYFNRVERDRLMATLRKQGDFAAVAGTWEIKAGGASTVKGKRALSEIKIKEKGAKDGVGEALEAIIDGLDYSLDPLATDLKEDTIKHPPGSGGLLISLYQYRRLLVLGEKGFVGDFSHGGTEPFYLPPPEKDKPDYGKLRIDTEVLRTRHAGIPAKWYFALEDDEARKIKKGTLIGFEVLPDRESDPCEVYLSDYETIDGRLLPKRMEVRFGDKQFANMLNVAFTLNAAGK
jgi:S1-C subfamily serine protease